MIESAADFLDRMALVMTDEEQERMVADRDAAIIAQRDEEWRRGRDALADYWQRLGKGDPPSATQVRAIEPVTEPTGDTLADLPAARDRVKHAQRAVIEQVRRARRDRKSWAEIGAAFGISRQAAWEAYARHVDEGE